MTDDLAVSSSMGIKIIVLFCPRGIIHLPRYLPLQSRNHATTGQVTKHGRMRVWDFSTFRNATLYQAGQEINRSETRNCDRNNGLKSDKANPLQNQPPLMHTKKKKSVQMKSILKLFNFIFFSIHVEIWLLKSQLASRFHSSICILTGSIFSIQT